MRNNPCIITTNPPSVPFVFLQMLSFANGDHSSLLRFFFFEWHTYHFSARAVRRGAIPTEYHPRRRRRRRPHGFLPQQLRPHPARQPPGCGVAQIRRPRRGDLPPPRPRQVPRAGAVHRPRILPEGALVSSQRGDYGPRRDSHSVRSLAVSGTVREHAVAVSSELDRGEPPGEIPRGREDSGVLHPGARTSREWRRRRRH
mmetsp:Transcript_38241/g.114467  ORF Transcript_38241/g.114467 Transcript_38241/m.114467 type:complete len:200 (-) Transcript_38241:564-1163(-)